MRKPTRREALKGIGVAGAGMLVAPAVIRGQDTGFTVAGKPIDLVVETVSPSVIRVTVHATGSSNEPSLTDGALVQSNWKIAGARTKPQARPAATSPVVAGANLVDIMPSGPSGGDLVISVRSRESRPGRAAESTEWQSFRIDRATGQVTFRLNNGPVLGLGQGGPQFDRRGANMPNRSGQGAYQLRTHGGRVPVQWVINGTAFYIHQPLGTLDFTGKDGVFTPPAGGELPLDFFVVCSGDPATIMKSWADITGYAELPPLWSLGYQQSHRTLGGPEEIMGIAKTFREKKLPCDSLIYLGTDFCPSGWNTHNGEFSWKPENFPDPKKAIDELHALNFKVTLHIVIEGQKLTGSVSDPCTAAPLPPGRTPDGRWPPDRQVSCYWPAHKPLFDLGIDGWWPDQGDGFDAASRLARNRMYWEGSQMYRPNQRVYALHRNGSPGMQRMASFLWSGDIYSLWETLKNHVPNAVNTSLSGIPYWGTDIGGFVPTADYTGELHVRWFQFGCFNTLFRAHGRTWHLRLPWGWNTGSAGVSEVAGYTGGAQDPPEGELHNAAVEPIIKKYLELRYQLLPYTYTAVRDCHETGMPIVRAMWLHYPNDAAACAKGDQYLWGRDILVAPVVEKGATTRAVYLPKGDWYDFWTSERLAGGASIERRIDLATMPIYVRAGAVIPLAPIRQYVDEPVNEPTTLVAYPGADGNASIYEDDGKTFNYRKGEWRRIAMRWADAARTLTLSLTPGSRPLGARTFQVRLAGTTTTRAVTFSGPPVSVRF